jgi:hypothetical protein
LAILELVAANRASSSHSPSSATELLGGKWLQEIAKSLGSRDDRRLFGLESILNALWHIPWPSVTP